jgi:hypothetical protein
VTRRSIKVLIPSGAVAALLIAMFALRPSYERITSGPVGEIDPVVSSNGRYLAYREMTPNDPALGVLRLLSLDDARNSRTLLGAGQFYGGVSWSPDNSSISYTNLERDTAGGPSSVVLSIFTLDIRTGEVRRVLSGNSVRGIGEYTSWSRDNLIAFAASDGIYRIDPSGGEPRKLYGFPAEVQVEPEHLVWSPDGAALAFSLNEDTTNVRIGDFAPGIVVVFPYTSRVERLTRGSFDAFPTWCDSHDLIYLSMDATQVPPRSGLYSVSLATHRIRRISGRAVEFSPHYCQPCSALFFASAEQLPASSRLLNTFHGFHIWKRTRPLDVVASSLLPGSPGS